MSSKYRTAPQVHFEEFRQLEKKRSDTSDAIWALMAGAQIASNTLNLTAQSSATLGEIFPSIRHVKRFNLRPQKAQALLDDAESELAIMGLSHTLAVHEDFVKSCLQLLKDLGITSNGAIKDCTIVNVHEKLQEISGRDMDPDTLYLFHLVRLVRNCHIHKAGTVNEGLVDKFAGMSDVQRGIWEELTDRKVEVPVKGEVAKVNFADLIASQAICKRLCYDINLCLQSVIPAEDWANMAAEEYFSQSKKSPRDPSALRSLKGYMRGRFDALSLSDQDLQDAINRR